MTAWLLVVCVICYIKLTFLFESIPFSVGKSLEPVGRWTETGRYKIWHSTLCYLLTLQVVSGASSLMCEEPGSHEVIRLSPSSTLHSCSIADIGSLERQKHDFCSLLCQTHRVFIRTFILHKDWQYKMRKQRQQE